MSRIGLGIVGCGRATIDLHLPALRSIPQIRIAAVADLDFDRARAISNSLGDCKAYSTMDEVVADPQVDAVAVCTPPARHLEPAIAALRAGKHLLVDKPIAARIDDAIAMASEAERSQQAALVGFNLRHHRLVERARHLIANGALGRVHSLTTRWGSTLPKDLASDHWRFARDEGGSALADLGSHHIDLCRFLLQDEFDSARAIERSSNAPDDNATLLAKMKSGVAIEAAFSLSAPAANDITIRGENATLSFSLYRGASFRLSNPGGAHRGRPWRDFGRRALEIPQLVVRARRGGDYLLSYRQQWRRFAAAVAGENTPSASFHDGLAALRVIDKARGCSSLTSAEPVLSPNL